MIFPNKFSKLDDSILAKLRYLVLEDIEEIAIVDLMKHTRRKFDDVGEFISALDVLYTLGKIELDIEKRTIRYVD